LLEWGPASLFYIKPRELIKVRTEWLEGGPIMPPFLSTRDESKASSSGICIRYALSAFEDLNKCIQNLRRAFGFPYQEYIGYLNTLSRTHRARREHEALVDRLRRWAIFGNVDAVVWIDYAKANQPPGSFKMGPRDSTPFGERHMEICTIPDDAVRDTINDVDSEGAWSEIDEEGGAAPITSAPHHTQQPNDSLLMNQGSKRTSILLQRGHSAGAVPLKRLVRASELGDQHHFFSSSSGAKTARSHHEKDPCSPGKLQENTLLRNMLQEEYVPPHGSIYTRSIAPGPGYYGAPGAITWTDEASVGGFGHRPRSKIDEVIALSKDLPGPHDYTPRQLELTPRMGRFDKGPRLVEPMDIARKLPFISALASRSEGHGVHSPNVFHSVNPDAPAQNRVRPPKYSFGKTRRPF